MKATTLFVILGIVGSQVHPLSMLQSHQSSPFPDPFPFLWIRGNQQPSGLVVGLWGLINCFPKGFEDEGFSMRDSRASQLAGRQRCQ